MAGLFHTLGQSIRIKIVLPLLGVSLLLSLASVLLMQHQASRQLEEKLVGQARYLSGTLLYVTNVVREYKSLNKIVEVLGRGDDVSMIVVVDDESRRVIASTQTSWVGKAVKSLPQDRVGEDIEEAFDSGQSAYHVHNDTGEFDLTLPFVSSNAVLKGHQPWQGVLMIHINYLPAEQKIAHETNTMIALLVSVISFFCILIYFLIDRFLLNPVKSIHNTMEARVQGDDAAYAEVLSEDEIGRTAKKLNTMLNVLTEREMRIKAVMENVVDGIVTIDSLGTIESFNTAAEWFFGYDAHEVIGKNVKILMPEPYHSEHDGYLANYLKTGRSSIIGVGREVVGLRKDGSTFPIDLAISELRVGGRSLFVGVVRDITERKRNEKLSGTQFDVTKILADAEAYKIPTDQLIRSICRNLDCELGAFWMIDVSGQNYDCTDIWHSEKVSAHEYQAISKTVVLKPGAGLVGRVLESLEPVWVMDIEEQAFFKRASVVLRQGLHSAFAFPVMNGKELIGVIEMYSRDMRSPDPLLLKKMNDIGSQIAQFITRRRVEKALQKSMKETDDIKFALDKSSSIIITDPEGKIVSTNDKFCELSGYGVSELVGKNHRLVNSGYHAPEFFTEMWQTIANGFVWHGEIRNQAKDGRLFWVSTTIVPFLDELGRPYQYVAIHNDITARKEMEEELRQAKEAALDASRLKSEFLANMSHEIRTPLNGVMGMTELALDTDLSEEQKEYLETAKMSADALLGVINDILDFSKIEAGKLELDPVPFMLRRTLANMIKPLVHRARKKDIDLAFHVVGDVPNALIGDPGRLRQIVVNLVDNAIKFTEEGEVLIQIEILSKDETAAELHFMVKDSGIGIPAEKQAFLFEPFVQADGTMTRKFGGSGLGLSISAQLVRMMGGNIWVESVPGVGSEFHFTVRLAVQENVIEREIPQKLTELSVLVVTNNRTTETVLTEIFKRWGLRSTVVDEKNEAYRCLIEAQQNNQPYPVVILEYNDAKKDNLAWIARVRRAHSLMDVALVLIKNADQKDILSYTEKYEIDGYVNKPINQSDLMDVMMEVMNIPSVSDGEWVSDLRPQSEYKLKPLNILLAEDNPVNQKFASRLLEKRGHRVFIANNGLEVLQQLQARNHDLILMDVQMPDMDGFEATKVIRDREQRTDTHMPIIAMTAHAMKGDEEKCLAVGMDGYLTKPVDQEKLFETIHRVLNRTIVSEQSQKSGSDYIMNHVKSSKEDGMLPVFEYDKLMDRLEGDQEFFQELVQLFLEESPQLIQDIHIAVDAMDSQALQYAAHAFKGACANMSAPALREVAFELEMMGKKNSLELAKEVFAQLNEEFQRLRDHLQERMPIVS